MTSKSDISAVPHSVILPLADEREVFSFQVSDLTKFILELSLYPTFGSKVIGRAVILPGTFLDIRYHKGFVVPLLDTQLKTIGEVAFEVSCIRPFEEAQLEIGGRVETYWKSKITPTSQGQDHAHAVQNRPVAISTHNQPGPSIARPSVGPQPPTRESALVTASSLSGEYVDLVVQVTSDGVPVAWPNHTLPVPGLDVGVADVTYEQFSALASSTGKAFSPPTTGTSPGEWYKAIVGGMTSLSELLMHIPPEIGLNVQLKYIRGEDHKRYRIGKSDEVNRFVDPILHVIYEAGKRLPGGRKIVLSSFDPTVCTALNWKQPNCEFKHYTGIDGSCQSRCFSLRIAVSRGLEQIRSLWVRPRKKRRI